MKFVSWNINGLRAICRKLKSIQELLELLNADVICFQETKLTRSELTRELALVPNWESFFAFSSTKTGYSGVATFCKTSTTTLPYEAYCKLSDFVESYEIVQDVFCEGIYELDLDGRCLVTVHDEFVLFNVYLPALTVETEIEDRMNLKVKWFQILDTCVRALIQRKFNVLLMGDFNCAPHMIDHCNPPLSEEFYLREDRRVLLKMLADNGGPCFDLFRTFYPTKFINLRTEAYSCWNQSTNARVNNYGTRLDLLLATGSSLDPCSFIDSFTDSGIMTDVLGSDHAPIWAERNIIEDGISISRTIPITSSRFLFRGKQTTMDSYCLQNGGDLKQCPESVEKEERKPKKKPRQITLKSFLETESSPPVDTQPIRQERGLTDEWKLIFEKNKPPLCDGHKEHCVMREVKKKGPNKGRRFYVCARAEGPAPIGRCDHFQWADRIKKHH